MLLQASAQRHSEPPVLMNTTTTNATLFDADGCPTTDPNLAFNDNDHCATNAVSAHRVCVGNLPDDVADGEKEVYFMRHAIPGCCMDCGLVGEGKAQCKGMKTHNRLLMDGALSENHSVEVVFSSPAARAIETAAEVFGGTNATFQISTLLVEKIPFTHCRGCGEDVVRRMESDSLRDSYYEIFGAQPWTEVDEHRVQSEQPWKDWHKDAGGRVEKFTELLRNRPEKRIAVVSHFHFLGSFGKELGMSCMEMGLLVVKGALDSKGHWRRISEASCQGRRRRWAYGNYRRQVPAMEEAEEGVQTEEDA